MFCLTWVVVVAVVVVLGCVVVVVIIFFFFKQKTAYEIVSRDWSSDVCSSDLVGRHSMDQ